MRPTRVSTLAVVALACALLSWLVLRSAYQSLPPLPWTGVPALLVAAAAEAWSGRDLRRRIAGRPGTKPPHPLFVSRMLVLAKASSMAAAVVGGLAFGFVGYVAGLMSAVAPRHDLINAGATCAGALVLAAAALYLEYCCRVPTGTKPPAETKVHLSHSPGAVAHRPRKKRGYGPQAPVERGLWPRLGRKPDHSMGMEMDLTDGPAAP